MSGIQPKRTERTEGVEGGGVPEIFPDSTKTPTRLKTKWESADVTKKTQETQARTYKGEKQSGFIAGMRALFSVAKTGVADFFSRMTAPSPEKIKWARQESVRLERVEKECETKIADYEKLIKEQGPGVGGRRQSLLSAARADLATVKTQIDDFDRKILSPLLRDRQSMFSTQLAYIIALENWKAVQFRVK